LNRWLLPTYAPVTRAGRRSACCGSSPGGFEQALPGEAFQQFRERRRMQAVEVVACLQNNALDSARSGVVIVAATAGSVRTATGLGGGVCAAGYATSSVVGLAAGPSSGRG
jgi:hypothetical protein